MLIAAAVVIASSIVLSSATHDQPSVQCITAYNATFRSTDVSSLSCAIAYFTPFFSDNVTDEQRMMVCSPGQQCNTMIENVINVCGDTVSFFKKLFKCS